MSVGPASIDARDGRVAWFHCFAGIAGDMALASLLDAGADEGQLRSLLATLPLPGWAMEVTRVRRGGLAATRVVVTATDGGPARRLPDVLEMLHAGTLPARALERSVAAFNLLAEVEGHLHGEAPEEVHFHELGGHDTVVDVAGTMVALELLDVATVASSPVATGSGTVESAHGTLPVPTPAVLGLLAGAPLYGGGARAGAELTTPTGAAILAATGAVYGPMPMMTVASTGYGAGGRQIEGLPNCTQVVVGTPLAATGGGAPVGQPLVLLEANVDDATGEELADAIAALLDGGASDAWTTPVLMKKGRPGHVVSVLAELPRSHALRSTLLRHTGSLGARAHLVDRYAVERELLEVDLDGTIVGVKVATGRVKVEHDDAAAIARREGVPVRDVVQRALRAYEQTSQP
ncbi:MAG: nickel pincer cofactor biosynthesis protein LarC [Acidimicrobiales bacterium]